MTDGPLDHTLLDGGNLAYLEEQFETYLQRPSAVEPSLKEYFDALPKTEKFGDISHAEIKHKFKTLTMAKAAAAAPTAGPADSQELKQIGVTQLINAYRARGHQIAKIDPLGRNRKRSQIMREVRLEEYGLSAADMDTTFKTPALFGLEQATLREIVSRLEATYAGSIGFEFMYVENFTQKEWLQARIEPVLGRGDTSADEKRWLLQRITAAEGLERHLHTKYVGQKRFSLEGGESFIVILSELVRLSNYRNVLEVVVGMAHRGRLNALVNILGKNPAELFSEFEGKKQIDRGAGDVKYHQGFSSDVAAENGKALHLTMAFNPSHLEIVSPVVEGSVRSRQDRHGDTTGDMVIPISVHGDAAFAGQGVVMETFNMAESRGYSTKGTIHIVINNQIGFTTSNLDDARSTEYCTDVAKMIGAPIFHVNGDDPEAVLEATRLAFEFRMQFHKDVVIDLVCYRRHGHNEADEPSATQPEMYRIIKALPTTRALYADKLAAEGVLTLAEAEQMVRDYSDALDAGQIVAPGVGPSTKLTKTLTTDWTPYLGNDNWRSEADTAVKHATVKALSDQLTTVPLDYQLHSRVAKIVDDRRKMAAGEQSMDWGFGETMAYATLLNDGYNVRITGQDCGRGTFFHRHAVLHHQETGESLVPLRELGKNLENPRDFLVIDSVLSEEAVLAFEYGYATHDPDTLVIWEAQFGDFANGAQVVIDQFISSGESKWGRLCGLTLLLPHGYEGQGPEHSSARPERFLQLCAEDNMQVIMPSTPAQCFHMLRRQMLRKQRRPLVVFTPKSLLRHKLAVSTMDEIENGAFQPVIDEITAMDAQKVDRVVLCSGKVYYDLLERRDEQGLDSTAIVRVEQLYPFPYDELKAALAHYPNAKSIIWCQEEPRNQGSWRASRHRVERVLAADQTLYFAGRRPSPSPAVGYASVHKAEQAELVDQALGLIDNPNEK